MSSILLRWNKFVFDKLVPEAWERLLSTLIHEDPVEDIYDAWPPYQHPTSSGDSSNWQSLPRNVLQAVALANAQVWPVIPADDSSNPEYGDLASVFVVAKGDEPTALPVLAKAGLKVSEIPRYMLELLMQLKVEHAILVPSAASVELSVCNTVFDQAHLFIFM
jgi:hypothetical protein